MSSNISHAASGPSYVDLPTLLSPEFSATGHANALVVATNNPDDPPPLDLSTPLSRALFDAQEIDSRIDTLATLYAVPLLTHTQTRSKAANNIVDTLDGHLKTLNESYTQLEKEVIQRHAEADEVRNVALRAWEALRLARVVGRCLNLGRQLEVQFAELKGSADKEDSGGNHGALIRCSHTVLSLRDVLDKTGPGQEGCGLNRVEAIRLLTETVTLPTERAVRDTSERIVREFSVSAAATFAQGEDAKSRTVSALTALYLLSPTSGSRPDKWTPSLVVQALESYVRTAVQSSVAGLARGLGQLLTFERALGEVIGRCQNVVALELVLEATRAPTHPLLETNPPVAPGEQAADGPDGPKKKDHFHVPPPNLLQPLLAQLETGSLASYFWRTTAGGVSSRVQELISRGGVAARTLQSNRDVVEEAIRKAVVKGSGVPSELAGVRRMARGPKEGKWDMETAVMVGSVINNLRR